MIIGNPMMFSGLGAPTYATWDPAAKNANITLSGGNLTVTNAATSLWRAVRATTSMPTGKWSWEGKVTNFGTAAAPTRMVGIVTSEFPFSDGSQLNGSPFAYGYYSDNTVAGIYRNNVRLTTWAGWLLNDVITLTFDADTLSLSAYRNGTLQGSVTVDAGVYYPAMSMNAANAVHLGNFGPTLTHPVGGFTQGVYS